MGMYIILGILSGAWALRRQHERYPEHVEWWRLTLVFLLNSLFWPITTLVAITKGTLV